MVSAVGQAPPVVRADPWPGIFHMPWAQPNKQTNKIKGISGLKVPEWSQMKGSSQPGSFPSLAGLSGFSELSSARPGRREILPWGRSTVLVSQGFKTVKVVHSDARFQKTWRNNCLSEVTLCLWCPNLKLIYSIVFKLKPLNQCQKSNLKFPFYFWREYGVQVKTAPKSNILYCVQ